MYRQVGAAVCGWKITKRKQQGLGGFWTVKKKHTIRTSLAVQWLRPCASDAGGAWVQSLVGELRCRLPESTARKKKGKTHYCFPLHHTQYSEHFCTLSLNGMCVCVCVCVCVQGGGSQTKQFFNTS